MPDMKQSEKFANARGQALATLAIPESAKEVKANVYAFMTDFGAVKVAVTAVKGDYDIEAEAEAFAAERKAAEVKAIAKKAEADAKKAAKTK